MATKGRNTGGSGSRSNKRRNPDPDGVIANRVLQDIIDNSSDQFREYLSRRGTMPPTPYPAPGSAIDPASMAPVPYPGAGSELSGMLGGSAPADWGAPALPAAPVPPVPYPGQGSPIDPGAVPPTPYPAPGSPISPQGRGIDPSLERLLAYFGLV